MIKSLYDFEKSLMYKMSVLEKEGKTKYIDKIFVGDEKHSCRIKGKKVFRKCKYDEHDMMILLPSYFKEELIFLYSGAPEDYDWDIWADQSAAEIAIQDPKTLLEVFEACEIKNDNRLINLVDEMFDKVNFSNRDRLESSIITIDSAIRTTNVYKRTKEFGYLLRAARSKYPKLYKYYLDMLPKKKEIELLPEQRRLAVESRINACLRTMCDTHSWENARILITKHGATISANYYEDFANKDIRKEYANNHGYKSVLKCLEKTKAEKEESFRMSLKNVVVRKPSMEELQGKQVSKDSD